MVAPAPPPPSYVPLLLRPVAMIRKESTIRGLTKNILLEKGDLYADDTLLHLTDPVIPRYNTLPNYNIQ